MEVINKYKDNPRVSKIMVNEENSGSTFVQWLKGFEQARGELIWIAESDDSCDKIFLETLVRLFVHEPKCVLAYTRSVLFTDDNGCSFDSYTGKKHEILSGSTFIAERMAAGNAIINASSAIFLKSVALYVDKQYTRYKGAGDRLFWIEIAEKGYVCIDYHPLNYFRIHDENSTKRYYFEGINQREDFKILQYIKKNNYINEKQYIKAKRIYAKWNIFSDRLSKKHKRDICKLYGVGLLDKIYIQYYTLSEIINYKIGCLFK